MGLAHYLMGEWEGAIQALREVARLQPDSSDAKNLLVAALDHHGNSEEANALRNEVAATGATSGTRELQPKQDVAKLSPTALAKMARVRMSMNSGAVR